MDCDLRQSPIRNSRSSLNRRLIVRKFRSGAPQFQTARFSDVGSPSVDVSRSGAGRETTIKIAPCRHLRHRPGFDGVKQFLQKLPRHEIIEIHALPPNPISPFQLVPQLIASWSNFSQL